MYTQRTIHEDINYLYQISGHVPSELVALKDLGRKQQFRQRPLCLGVCHKKSLVLHHRNAEKLGDVLMVKMRYLRRGCMLTRVSVLMTLAYP